MPTKPRRAVLYVRISKDRADETSTSSQEAECRAYCDRVGLEVLAVESDVGKSAYKRRVRRPGLDRCLELIDSGAADVLVVWSIDRLARSVVDLGGIVERLDSAGAGFAAVTQQIDTTGAMGKAMVMMIGVLAQLESGMRGERIKAWHGERAARALPPVGPPPFGYRRPKAGTLVVDKAQAKLVTEVVDRLLAGDSVRSQARWLTDRTGRTWSSTSVRKLVTNPTLAGVRVDDGVTVPGTWEPVIERDRWEAVRDLLLDPTRANAGAGSDRRHLLTGIAECGRCGTRMHSTSHTNGHHRYHCPECSLSIVADVTDEAIGSAVLELLDPKAWAKIRSRGRVLDVTALEAELDELARLYGAGELTLAEWMAARDGVKGRVAEAKDRTTKVPEIDDVRRAWPDLDVRGRRLVLDAVIDRVVVAPAVRGRNRFDDERLTIHWRV